MTKPYDSTSDTQAHINRVGDLLNDCCMALYDRADKHDASKLQAPEKAAYDEMTPLLKGLTYGSDEYRACLKRMRPAIDHHYAMNSHHPEHYERGIRAMSLLDILEMFCDWKAASERHADGNFAESLRINKERFGISDQLADIFERTREELGW